MSLFVYSAPRLFIENSLKSGDQQTNSCFKFQEQAAVPLSADQEHYLLHVMRLKEGDTILVFNGQDGEWLATMRMVTRKKAEVVLQKKIREQSCAIDLYYYFAPLKHARLDYTVQKAVEMGVRGLGPVLTERTQIHRVNEDRIRANCIEAAEQCGILSLPDIKPLMKLETCLEHLEMDRVLIFCDEETPCTNPLEVLISLKNTYQKFAVLIGPEGGFSERERERILQHEQTARLSLGPRILRADTASVAALTLVQSCLGDWKDDKG